MYILYIFNVVTPINPTVPSYNCDRLNYAVYFLYSTMHPKEKIRRETVSTRKIEAKDEAPIKTKSNVKTPRKTEAIERLRARRNQMF